MSDKFALWHGDIAGVAFGVIGWVAHLAFGIADAFGLAADAVAYVA